MGADFIPKLRGFFAFAFYRQDTGEILLARDHAGIKPCMFSVNGNILRFSSESRAIHQMGLRVAADVSSLHAYLEFHFIPPERSAWQHIQALSPGSWLRYSTKGIETGKWLADAKTEDATVTEDGYGYLQQAIRRNLVSDIPVGIFLSSGLDSSLLALLASRQHAKAMHAFTLVMENTYLDESADARAIALQFGLQHTQVALLPDTALQWLECMPEPVADPAGIATFRLAQAASAAGVKVILAGDGADEVFGGYQRYTAWGLLQTFASGLPFPEMRIPEGKSRESSFENLQRKVTRFMALARLPISQRYRRLCAFQDPTTIRQVLSKDCEPYMPTYDFQGVQSLRQVLDMDFQFLLPGNMLPKSDLSAMASAVEVRLPWLDEDIVAWMRTMPDAQLKHKKILRQAWQHFSGKPFMHRKKGLDVPIEAMLKSGRVYEYWMDQSASAQVRDAGYFDKEGLQALRKSKGHAELKWTLLTWMQVVLGR